MSVTKSALIALGKALQDRGYQFTTITPLSHLRFLKKCVQQSNPLTDFFGWSKAVDRRNLDPSLFELAERAEILIQSENADFFKSRIRFSTLGGKIFLHSAFPTEEQDSVFFGPDTYRFVRFVLSRVTHSFDRGVDLGCGTGVGGLSLWSLCRKQMVLSDINEQALRYASINSELNSPSGQEQIVIEKSNLFEKLSGTFDLILSNPPFLADPLKRSYRDGGGRYGTALSEEIIRQSLKRLNIGGKLLLYTGSPVRGGEDLLAQFIKCQVTSKFKVEYSEIDPDIFGEDLDCPGYEEVERLAAVGIVVEKLDS